MLGLSSEQKAANGKAGASKSSTSSLVIPELESFPDIREKRSQWLAANSRSIGSKEKIKRVKEERRKFELGLGRTSPADLEERAKASLRGEEVATAPREDLSALNDEDEVFQAALNMAKNLYDKAVGRVSVEVCKRFSGESQARAKKIALCAIALSEALEEHDELYREIRARGFQLTEPIASLPRLQIRLGRPDDQNSALFDFLRRLRAKGIEI
jgi:hypothetical protein